MACCMSFMIIKLLKKYVHNEGPYFLLSALAMLNVHIAQKRRILAAAASAGISVAFGSPLGGVLFGLEELDTFAKDSDVLWRGFVTSAIAAVSLQYIDPFGTSKLVLFQVTGVSDTWRAFELVSEINPVSSCIDSANYQQIPWLMLSVMGVWFTSLLVYKLMINSSM